MSAPQTATGMLQVSSFYMLGIKDANGNLAQAYTPFYQTPTGLIVPAPTDANGNPQMSVAGSSVTLPVSGQGGKIISPYLPTIPSGPANPIPYTEFAASSSVYYIFSGLNANAIRRALIFKNTMNEALTLSDVGICFAAVASGDIKQLGSLPTGLTIGASPLVTVIDSEAYPVIGTPGDEIELMLTMGATAPTSGELYVYVAELLG